MRTIVGMQMIVGALLVALPNMTRRELLFAVPVPPDFRQSHAGRRALAAFRLMVAAVVLAGVAVLLLSPTRLIDAILPAVILGTVIAAFVAFYWQYRMLIPFAVTVTGRREAQLTTAPDRLPWFAWLGACPFAALGAAALYLYLNWGRIPERFPIHWGAGGPDEWANRSVRGVYGSLLLGVELSVFFLILAMATWYGSRRSRSRTVMTGGIIGINIVLGASFAVFALQPVLEIGPGVITLGTITALAAVIAVMWKQIRDAAGPPDPTPQECWKAGIIYYNPNDAVLFVEKRGGFGYTLNFANRWSWALLAGLGVVLASIPFIG